MNPLSKPRLIFLLLAILATFLAHAQGGLGYILLKEGDTLRGDIKIKQGYASAPKVIQFAGTESAAPKDFSVNDCQGFVIGDNVYLRATVTMDLSFLANIEKSIFFEDSSITQTVFLRRIYKGQNINLFKYHDGEEKGFIRKANVKTHFFVQDKDKVQELIIKYDYAPRRSLHNFDTNKNVMAVRRVWRIYKDQLKLYYDWMTETELQKQVDKADYLEDHLLKVIAAIDKKFRPISDSN